MEFGLVCRDFRDGLSGDCLANVEVASWHFVMVSLFGARRPTGDWVYHCFQSYGAGLVLPERRHRDPGLCLTLFGSWLEHARPCPAYNRPGVERCREVGWRQPLANAPIR